MLTADQIDFYEANGYLVLESLIPGARIAAIREEVARLVEGARGRTESDDLYDLEDSHRHDRPRVRRIKYPNTVSPVFDALMRDDLILQPVRDLIGSSLRLHTSKLNLKSAEYGAPVEWHQDWAFYPHTNDDILAVGVMLNDVDETNGPLMIVPGSHKGPVFDHHRDGMFCGAIDPATEGLGTERAVALTGPAGSVSLHHVRAVHGSDLNTSGRDRGLLLYEITAADAWPLQGSLSTFGSLEEYDRRLLCGNSTITPRLTEVPVRLPVPSPANYGSIYNVQKRMGARAFRVLEGERT